MFIMHWVGVSKVPPSVDDLALKSYHKIHVEYRVQVKWGKGGLKRKQH